MKDYGSYVTPLKDAIASGGQFEQVEVAKGDLMHHQPVCIITIGKDTQSYFTFPNRKQHDLQVAILISIRSDDPYSDLKTYGDAVETALQSVYGDFWEEQSVEFANIPDSHTLITRMNIKVTKFD